MKQPVFEVREKKTVLILGIIFTIIFGAMALVMLGAEKADIAGIIFSVILFVIIAVLGLYLVMAYFTHRLKVFADGECVYVSFIGKKTSFTCKDIARIEQKYMSRVISLRLRDASGKCVAKVESNMINYDRLCRWLIDCKQEMESRGNIVNRFGVNMKQEIMVEPVKVLGAAKKGRIFLGILGVIILLAAGGVGLSLFSGWYIGEEAEETVSWFDSTVLSEEKQKVNVQMISYAFATFGSSDKQGVYFVFDEDMAVYIVCMDNARLETEFADIYEFTFTETLDAPQIGMLEGYARAIEDDLKELAIEEFNYLWGEDFITEENFENYIGSYYLDTTYQPVEEGKDITAIVVSSICCLGIGICCLGIGVYLLYYAVKGCRKAQEKMHSQNDLLQYAKAFDTGK